MNFKKNWKRFWTLSSVREGFTLVELIVVIAILAILAGVAVPAYSGYVKKANMQADMTLASEVAHALTLYYYAHPEEVTSGYVVLAPDVNKVDADAVGEAAMIATFGAGWKDASVLKYNGWSDNGMMELVGDYTADELALVANSSFLTHSNAEGLMGAVTGLTGLVGDVIREKSADPEKARNNLAKIFGEDSEILDKLDALDEEGLKGEDYPTAISNLLVNHMASTIETEPCLQAIVNMYATAYAYGEKTGDYAAFNQMNTNLENISMDILAYEGASTDEEYAMGYLTMLNGMTTFNGEEDVPIADFEGFWDYMSNTGTEQITKDNEALSTMMGAIQHISDNFLEVDHVTNSELFATGEVAEQVNNYMNSVKALAGMDDATRNQLANVPAGSIVVFVNADGSVTITPNAAVPQN